jgi:hypothetical protein
VESDCKDWQGRRLVVSVCLKCIKPCRTGLGGSVSKTEDKLERARAFHHLGCATIRPAVF